MKSNEYCKDEFGNIYKGKKKNVNIQGECIKININISNRSNIKYEKKNVLKRNIQERSTPEGSIPEGSTPEGSTPEGSTPEKSTPEGSTNGSGKIGYYLKNELGELITNSDTVGTLYLCTTVTDCREVLNNEVKTGYYYNADESSKIPLLYIGCKKGSNKCWTISATVTTTNDCSKVNEGGIIGVKKGENPIIYKLCLNDSQEGKVVPLSETGKYFVSVNKENIFGKSTYHYALIEIKSDGTIIKDGKL